MATHKPKLVCVECKTPVVMLFAGDLCKDCNAKKPTVSARIGTGPLTPKQREYRVQFAEASHRNASPRFFVRGFHFVAVTNEEPGVFGYTDISVQNCTNRTRPALTVKAEELCADLNAGRIIYDRQSKTLKPAIPS